jgi:hypothetical protein
VFAPPDSCAITVSVKAEATEHVNEEQVLFHSVATSAADDEFVVDGLGAGGRWCEEVVISGERGSRRGLKRGSDVEGLPEAVDLALIWQI